MMINLFKKTIYKNICNCKDYVDQYVLMKSKLWSSVQFAEIILL